MGIKENTRFVTEVIMTKSAEAKKEILRRRRDLLGERRAKITKETKNNMWIEVTECRPIRDEYILISLVDGTVECAMYNGLTWTNSLNNARECKDVIAWQPLPDAYEIPDMEDIDEIEDLGLEADE